MDSKFDAISRRLLISAAFGVYLLPAETTTPIPITDGLPNGGLFGFNRVAIDPRGGIFYGGSYGGDQYDGVWRWNGQWELINRGFIPTGSVAGRINLQGRPNPSGIQVEIADGSRVFTLTTNISGEFSLSEITPGSHPLTASKQNYLSAVMSAVVSEYMTATLPTVRLLGGDVNHDQKIDIFDLTLMGANFGKAGTEADINADGTVNIFDLSQVGANFGRRGPTPWEGAPTYQPWAANLLRTPTKINGVKAGWH